MKKPPSPARQMIHMGWSLVKYTSRNDTAQISMLNVLSGKFCRFISSRAAEAIRPITTGRRPAKIPFMTSESL